MRTGDEGRDAGMSIKLSSDEKLAVLVLSDSLSGGDRRGTAVLGVGLRDGVRSITSDPEPPRDTFNSLNSTTSLYVSFRVTSAGVRSHSSA